MFSVLCGLPLMNPNLTPALTATLTPALAPVEAVGLHEFLFNYTFRNMLVGTTLIGAFAGSLGSFLYLKKQSLISDVIGHSAILGVVGAFVVAAGVLGLDGRSMPVLTIGAVVAAVAATWLANFLTHISPLKIDATMVICLALFYGGGMVGLRQLTHSALPNRGGIDKYLFGNAATLTYADILSIIGFGTAAILVVLACWKEFKLHLFDPIGAQVAGFAPRVLHPLLFTTVTVAIVVGLKAVGMILMIAFAIMPAVAARQWAHHLSGMVVLAGILGALGGAGGSFLAVNLGKVPTGPVVVLVLFVIVVVSLVLAKIVEVISRRVALRGLDVARGKGVPVHEVPAQNPALQKVGV